MRVIHKYNVPIGAVTPTHVPKGARILYVDTQSTGVYFWAMVDSDAPLEIRRFTAIGTGYPVPMGGVYIGTGQSPLEHVWHIFEIVSQ